VGRTLKDKTEADGLLLDNMIATIYARTKFAPLRPLRCYRAMTYFVAVREHGQKAFWAGKTRHKDTKAPRGESPAEPEPRPL